MSVVDKTENSFLHTDLAPSYRELSKDYMKKMDDDLKIMIAGTMKILSKTADKSWESVLGVMMQNELLEPDSSEVARADKLIKEGTSAFKTDGSADSGVVREVS